MNLKTYHYTRTVPGGPWFECPTATIPAVKVERPIRPDIAARCAYVLHGPIEQGRYKGFTGLQATKWERIYTGDLLLPAGKSFVIAELKADTLTLAIAEGYRVFPRRRSKVVEEYLKEKSRAI